MLLLLRVLDRSLCGGQAGDGHAEGGAGHVVQAHLVAELHGGGVAAVLAADAQVQVGTGLAAHLGGHLHQLAHADLIQAGEGIALVDLVVVVGGQELAGIVTAEAEGHLGQVVRAEGEELGLLGDLVGGEGDFEGIYEAMEGCPVTIRFLDPPLHEFVPTEERDIELLAKDMNKSVADIKAIISSLHEFNPMMGHRGCRLAVTFPEIAVMQTRAVIRAAINVQKKHPDWNMVPEIMIPLVGEVKELKFVKDVVVKTADEELAAAGMNMKYLVGTMIEIPRAALTADAIATEAEFFSFGTNDLTQMTFGFSRDDAGKFLPAYYDNKIYESDPFARLDQVGVGKLVDMACKLGRATRPDIHLGICGEHGGDPSSVEFCHRVGLDYVSCSPFRVPIARLAAAQAAIKDAK